jgi:hypothetical protein
MSVVSEEEQEKIMADAAMREEEEEILRIQYEMWREEHDQ